MNHETRATPRTSRLWLVRMACGLAVGVATCNSFKAAELKAAEATSGSNEKLFEGQI